MGLEVALIRFWLSEARLLLLISALAASVLLVVVCALTSETSFAVPGVDFPIPAYRLFPTLFAAVAALPLSMRWPPYDAIAVRSMSLFRLCLVLVGSALTLTSAVAASYLAASALELKILPAVALLAYAILVAAVALGGQWWWLPTPILLYLQLHLSQPALTVSLSGLVLPIFAAALVLYVAAPWFERNRFLGR